jgi:hypothetical protein
MLSLNIHAQAPADSSLDFPTLVAEVLGDIVDRADEDNSEFQGVSPKKICKRI